VKFRPWQRLLTCGTILGLLILVWWRSSWLSTGIAMSHAIATTPTDLVGFKELQKRVEAAAEKVGPAVVAIEFAGAADLSPAERQARTFKPFCSGVIISADGLILSQCHVTHRLHYSGVGSTKLLEPHKHTKVVLADGRILPAELLGADEASDLSLARLLEPGPFPYAPLSGRASVSLGDWVLKLGHPIGYRPDRPAVVRLGRVVLSNDEMFVTDTFTTGGDSGGPFFDLAGNLVGIIGSSDIPSVLRNTLRGEGRTDPYSATPTAIIEKLLPSMLSARNVPFDTTAPNAVSQGTGRSVNALPLLLWTNGVTTLEALAPLISDLRGGVVTILDENDRQVLLGTVVRSDGLIASIASQLPKHPKCRLSDGRVRPATVVGMDAAFDLVLVQIAATELAAIDLADKPQQVAGAILAAIGFDHAPAAIGIVSVPERTLPGPFPPRVLPVTTPAAWPNVSGSASNAGYLVSSDYRALATGSIHAGDLLLSIAGKRIRTDEDLFTCVAGHLGGESVPVRLMRDGQEQEVTIRLEAEPLSDSKPVTDYPIFFEHDMPLPFNQCGGPVIDLDGRVVGMTMYRGQYGCMAIPGASIKGLLAALLQGKSAE
jgi:serine protease Do